MIDRQKCYDIAAKGLLKQNNKSMRLWTPGDPPVCAYRGDNGTKCAVGFLIPDEKYHLNMEGDINALVTKYDPGPLLADAVDTDIDFLEALQAIHDSGVCNPLHRTAIDN